MTQLKVVVDMPRFEKVPDRPGHRVQVGWDKVAVTVDIDDDRVVRTIGGRAWANRTKKATLAHGMIKATAETIGPQDSASSIQCPHCKWGFAPSVIDQHIREKH